MDVLSCYANINHNEDGEICFKKLEERKNKSIPSTVIKVSILMFNNSVAFQFGKYCYRQLISTAVVTPVAQNYVDLFMDHFEQNLLQYYFLKTGLSPYGLFSFY